MADLTGRDIGFDFEVPSDEEGEGDIGGEGISRAASAESVGSIPSPSASPPVSRRRSDDGGAAGAATATPDAERQILLLMLLAQVCSLHDPTPRTFTVHVLSLFERGILDRDSVRFLFDLGLVPGDYQFGASSSHLLEYDGGVEWQQQGEQVQMTDAVVPYKHGGGKHTNTLHTPPRSANRNRVHSSDLNTGDTAILGVVNDFDGDTSNDDNPLRFIFGEDVEEATRAHRQKVLEKARAMRVAERRRREVEVQSIKEHLERHDSVLSDNSKINAEVRSTANARNRTESVAASASSVDESIRGGEWTSEADQNRAQRQQEQQQQQAGASWSVASHPLSLSRYTRDFISLGLLASGAFGDVYRAKSKFDQSEYAIKRVCFTAEGFDNATVQTVIREVQCLAQLDHPNVVRYFTSWLEPSWMTGGGKEVDIDAVGTEEERGKLLEGVKRLVLLEDGKADTDESHVTGEDTIGTLEKNLKELGVSSRLSSSNNNRNLSRSSEYGDHVDTGFSFERGESAEGGDQEHLRWDQLNSHNTYTSQSTGEYGNDSAYSEWTDYGTTNGGHARGATSRDFSVSGQKASGASEYDTIGESENKEASIASIEGGERSGGPNNRRKHAKPFQQAQKNQRRPTGQYQQTFTGRQYRYRLCLFVQMQLCRPSTLADWIQARNHSVRTVPFAQSSLRNQPWVEPALRIFLQITRGLVHVHSKGIIHRDIKPQNIFAALDSGVEGEIPCFRIGDFGLSKMLLDANGGQAFESGVRNNTEQNPMPNGDGHDKSAENIGHSNTLAVPREAHTVGIGTASYASPEQVTSSNYGSAADIFSMGLILLELFSTIDSLHERAKVFGDCRRGLQPNRLRENFPEIASLVADCTHQTPAMRPTARALQQAIESHLGKTDCFPEAAAAEAKGTDVCSSEIQELRAKLREREDELATMKRLLKEKDEIIRSYQRQLEDKGSMSRENMSNHMQHRVDKSNSGSYNDADDGSLGVVHSASMSNDEDY